MPRNAGHEIITRFDSLLKSIGSQIDTSAIVAGIRQEIEYGLKRHIIAPFVGKTNELAKEVTPALKELRDAAGEARKLWPKHIWQTVWFSGAIVMMMATALITVAIHMRFESRFTKTIAPKIVAAERSLEQNREAFRELAIAGVAIKVLRTGNAAGVTTPGGFAIAVEILTTWRRARWMGKNTDSFSSPAPTLRCRFTTFECRSS